MTQTRDIRKREVEMSSVEGVPGVGALEGGQKKVGEETLAPQRERIMDPWSYLFA